MKVRKIGLNKGKEIILLETAKRTCSCCSTKIQLIRANKVFISSAGVYRGRGEYFF